ncbi:MAG: hypothetical protein IJ711_08370 [Lachnospiraceae bacterium]|nr:hypothetical protein [Lachnospiraceae bacterium]
MNMIRMAGALLLLLCGSSMIGMIPAALLCGRKEQDRHCCAGRALLLGTGICMLCFALPVTVACVRGKSFLFVFRLGGSLLALLLALALCLLFFIRRVRRFCMEQLALLRSRKWWISFGILAGLYASLAIICLLHRPLLESRFDLPERLSAMQGTNLMGGINPLTGEMTGVSSGWGTAARSFLPAWYLFLMRLFHLQVWDMLFKVAPLWLLALCMSAYYEIGAVVLSYSAADEAITGGQAAPAQNRRRLLIYMAFFTIFTLCGNGAYMNPSYGLLHYAYEETTLLGSVLLPAVFALLLTAFRLGRSKGRQVE